MRVILLIAAWACAEATDCTKTADFLENCDQWTACVKSAGVGCYCPNGCTGRTGLCVWLPNGWQSRSMVSPRAPLPALLLPLSLSLSLHSPAFTLRPGTCTVSPLAAPFLQMLER